MRNERPCFRDGLKAVPYRFRDLKAVPYRESVAPPEESMVPGGESTVFRDGLKAVPYWEFAVPSWKSVGAGLQTRPRGSALSVVALVVILAQAPALGQGAADPNWSQFRGSAQLTGGTASVAPATPTLRWTYESGDGLESSS